MVIRLNEIANIVNNTHPMNVVNKVGNLDIGFYKVNIQYITGRKNKRQRSLLFIINSINPEEDLKNEVSLWQDNYNSNKPNNRRISNAIILDRSCIGLIRL